MKSIVLKLTAIMLCVIIIGIAITAGTAMVTSGNVIRRESLGKMERNAQSEASRLDSWLRSHEANVITLAGILGNMDGNLASEENRRILKGIIEHNTSYNEVYMGFPDDTALMGSGFPIEELYDTWKATQRSWYQLALSDTRRAHISDPYIDTVTGQLCITVSHAVVRGGRVVGVAAADILIPEIQMMIESITFDFSGYAMLIGTVGDILVHPGEYSPDVGGGSFHNLSTVSNGIYDNLWRSIKSTDGAHMAADAGGTNKYYTSSTIETSGWHLVTILPTSAVTQYAVNIVLLVVPLALAIVAAAALIMYLAIKNVIAKPLAALTGFMKKASATGDISLSPEDVQIIEKQSSYEHEIAQCIKSCAAFVGRITEVSEALETVAGNDLTVKLDLLSEKDTMGISLQKMLENLNDMFEEINSSAVQVSTGSKQIADGAQMLAQGSTEQAASIEQLSSSISTIASKTKENASMAGQAAELAGTIMQNAERGSVQMDSMMEAVNEISQASQDIGKVIKAIDDIAFQTNILALNAAVEAARAGQHGKGFAVVAEEVRNLASKSAEAAKDTSNLIANSIEKAQLGSRIASETAGSLLEIVNGITQSSKIVSEIALSSEEQSMGIEQVNIGINQVTQVVQQNSATAQQSAAASEQMNGQSAMLEQLISQFKLKGDSSRVIALPMPKASA